MALLQPAAALTDLLLGLTGLGMGWVAILAAVLQAAKASFTLVWTFDQNRVYHLVQTVALIFLYRGVVTESDGPARSTTKTA